jgi:hypothetical protein
MGRRPKIFIKPPVKKPFTWPYCREGLETLEELEAHTKLHPALRLGAWRMNNPVGGGLWVRVNDRASLVAGHWGRWTPTCSA